MDECWGISFHPDFEAEFRALPEAVQDEVVALAAAVAIVGPQLGRPRVDTLKGSRHANMKEGRFTAAGGIWRLAFAFDPERKAILLICANKSGVSQRRFYKALIGKADERFAEHLRHLAELKERKQ
jgi:hypothetical protein